MFFVKDYLGLLIHSGWSDMLQWSHLKQNSLTLSVKPHLNHTLFVMIALWMYKSDC